MMKIDLGEILTSGTKTMAIADFYGGAVSLHPQHPSAFILAYQLQPRLPTPTPYTDEPIE